MFEPKRSWWEPTPKSFQLDSQPLPAASDAIADGVSARSLKDELLALETREDEIREQTRRHSGAKLNLAPNMAEIHRQRIGGLQEAFAPAPSAAELTRQYVPLPLPRTDLHGEAAAILQLSAAGKKGPLGEG